MFVCVLLEQINWKAAAAFFFLLLMGAYLSAKTEKNKTWSQEGRSGKVHGEREEYTKGEQVGQLAVNLSAAFLFLLLLGFVASERQRGNAIHP